MSKDSKEVVEKGEVYEIVQVDNSPVALANSMLANGSSPEYIEKMMELQFKHEANEARKAYFNAITEFKKNPPKILKDKHVYYETKTGATEYNHASLGNVTETISMELSKHGLSANWKQSQDNGQLTVTCILTHRLGHSESTSLTAANDTSGGKNTIQAVSSTNSYLCRYTLLAISGLATHDMDDDGRNSEPQELITESQVADIRSLLSEKGKDEARICKAVGTDVIENIWASNYNRVVGIINGAQ
jgi:hypothetical protein